MKLLTLVLLLAGFTMKSQAADIAIVDVRRNITMSEDDTVYKDFYINAGPSSGLKKNLVVTAVRKLNIRDASGANAVGEITVPVGQLKIIAVYDKVAVAREYTLLSRDELPMLEQIGIMTGDRIDLQGSFIDNSKPKAKRKVAESSGEGPTASATVVAVTVAPSATALPTVTGALSPATAAPTGTNPVVSANTKANSLLSAATNSSSASAAPAAAASSAPAGETLEKTADSGNNTLHE
ncbi:hypothetical protein AZI85_08370 [Bdellovibrio bacteriovorus]|uniref:Uncharacterized protein n=1 Tax=Bdellovibrio bacteriovorus TaxID=959 RepID=A0A150WH27_BDEBC|nr:hypothetical protein [Bdellovibrio bacteriovorus]KYG62195.1 hypothetical protein AZI85_08370 [Bdellovibrio bacteriovorus]